MQLSRLTAVLLASLAVSACRDSTAPVLRIYALSEIDGHPLPLTSCGIDACSTQLWGKLYLDQTSHATRADHYRWFGAIRPDKSESTQTLRGTYRITNDSITVGWQFGSCAGSCLPNDVGAFSHSMLTLTVDLLPRTRPVYTYRLVARF